MASEQRKEIGVLFNGPMVRTILEGRKTMTRRPVNAGNYRSVDPDTYRPMNGGLFVPSSEKGGIFDVPSGRPSKAMQETVVYPPWKPGDVLWARENYRLGPEHESIRAAELAGDNERNKIDVRYEANGAASFGGVAPLDEAWGSLRPSIHMPRWASRLTLEVESVKVERVQDISEEDARAEGVECPDRITMLSEMHRAGRVAFRDLWQSTYPGSWDRNDWVWAYTFKVLTTTPKATPDHA